MEPTKRHEPESEDGSHYACGRCGERLTDEQIGESQDAALPLCVPRPVAWRSTVATVVTDNRTRIACVGATPEQAEEMRAAGQAQVDAMRGRSS